MQTLIVPNEEAFNYPGAEVAFLGDGTARIVERTLEDYKTIRLQELADFRYRIETGGIVVGGLPIPTDRDSQKALLEFVVAQQLAPTLTIPWKQALGQFSSVTTAQVLTIANAVITHKQACFKNEETHTTAMAALKTLEAVVAYDLTQGWPS